MKNRVNIRDPDCLLYYRGNNVENIAKRTILEINNLDNLYFLRSFEVGRTVNVHNIQENCMKNRMQ